MKDITPSPAARRMNDLTPPETIGEDDATADMAPNGKRREPIDPDDVDAGITGDSTNGRREPIHPDDIGAFDDLPQSGGDQEAARRH